MLLMLLQLDHHLAPQQGVSEPGPLHQVGGRTAHPRQPDAQQGQRPPAHSRTLRWHGGQLGLLFIYLQYYIKIN